MTTFKSTKELVLYSRCLELASTALRHTDLEDERHMEDLADQIQLFIERYINRWTKH